MSLDRSGRVVYARLELARDKDVIKRGQASGCHGGSCLICLEELWGWGSEVSVRGFVLLTNTRIMVLWAGRMQKKQGALQEQRAGLWGSEESKRFT